MKIASEVTVTVTTNNDRPVAFITGAAKRVGRAVALELARAGYDIVIHFNRSASDAEHTAGEIKNLGSKAILVRGDLSDHSTPGRMVAEAVRQTGRIDVLVNNASVFDAMTLEEFDFQKWHNCMTINLAAPIRLCQLIVPIMQKQSAGCIVNFCDSSTDRPWENHLAYGCSKAGLEYVTRALARALAPSIRVNGVAPGIAVFPEHYSTELREKLIKRVPLKREGTPEEMAKAVRFLVASTYITGQIINVDGGRSII